MGSVVSATDTALTVPSAETTVPIPQNAKPVMVSPRNRRDSTNAKGDVQKRGGCVQAQFSREVASRAERLASLGSAVPMEGGRKGYLVAHERDESGMHWLP